MIPVSRGMQSTLPRIESEPYLSRLISDGEAAHGTADDHPALGAREDELIVHPGLASGCQRGMSADVAVLAGPCRAPLHRSPGDQLELKAGVVIRGHLLGPPLLILFACTPIFTFLCCTKDAHFTSNSTSCEAPSCIVGYQVIQGIDVLRTGSSFSSVFKFADTSSISASSRNLQ